MGTLYGWGLLDTDYDFGDSVKTHPQGDLIYPERDARDWQRAVAERDAEIAALKTTLDASDDQYALGEITRLRAALKPFAEAAKRLTHMSGEGAALVSVADLRSALKAIGEES